VGFSEVVEATIINIQDSKNRPLSSQISPEQTFMSRKILEILNNAQQTRVQEIREALAPETVMQLAKHAISHGNYTVLQFILNENLCLVNEAMLLRAVNAYEIRKTSGSGWREPAEVVELLLQFVKTDSRFIIC
jgi:hypothetical protein